MTARRRWWIAGGIVTAVVALVAVLCVVLLTGRSTSDCTTVRSMLSYNEQFDHAVEASAESGVEPSVADYQNWASKMGEFAGQIDHSARAERAKTLANLAEQTVSVVQRFRADPSITEDPSSDPPQYVQDYVRLGKEFDANLVALDRACPA